MVHWGIAPDRYDKWKIWCKAFGAEIIHAFDKHPNIQNIEMYFSIDFQHEEKWQIADHLERRK